MADSVAIDMRDITVTPVFRYDTIEDINASERAGHLVKKVRQVVEVRFAGSRNYSPVFPVDAFWERQNGRVVTYAERWSEQYRAFLDGSAQEASGTPLEMLRSYGIRDSQLSLCKALKIYSIEALYHLEGDALKSLQMSGNDLKDMARRYMADRAKGSDATDRIAELEAQIARLTLARAGTAAQTTEVLVKDASPVEMDAALATANAEYDALTDDELKDRISDLTGSGRPRGNPSRQTLVQSLRELEGAA